MSYSTNEVAILTINGMFAEVGSSGAVMRTYYEQSRRVTLDWTKSANGVWTAFDGTKAIRVELQSIVRPDWLNQ